ncbi:sulfite exporter TauE/SafE family protein [Chitinophaga deserti]|uniref:sulfite exporter TauE/SafE family protein n=1 Tax=Chitinophaga deserti TaxID=2164099 RepID=UPI0018E5A473|nr:sulfite exporter TauE/SafE family protein [Chitinophaga deserti]
MTTVMTAAWLLSGLGLGFLGSFHCIGMCGPIALTLPVQHLSGWKKMGGILLYNAGRVVTYMLLGMVFGWLGQQFYLGGWQQWLSVFLGLLLLAAVLFGKLMPSMKIGFVQRALGQLLSRRSTSTLFAIGFLNGLLPCGMVYMAIAGAVASGSIWGGMLFMGAFGAGTLPAMAAVTWFSQLLGLRGRKAIRSAMPYVVSLMAVLLILRGLNLGIPYVSPEMHPHTERVFEKCHK